MSSYHGWTHAPKSAGGTDPIPSVESYFRAYFMRYTGSPLTVAQTGFGTTSQGVVFDWWQTNNEEVFQPRAASGYSNPPVMSTDLIDKVRLKAAGSYTIGFHFLLNDPIVGHAWHWSDGDAPFGYADSFVGGGDRHPSLSFPSGPIYNTVGWVGGSIHLIYPMPDYSGDPPDVYWPDFAASGFAEGSVQVNTLNMTSSSDNEIELAKLEILYRPLGL